MKIYKCCGKVYEYYGIYHRHVSRYHPERVISHSERKANRIRDYDKNLNKCQECNTVFNYNERSKKFCNQSCAASFNNKRWSSEIKQKRKQTLKSIWASKNTHKIKKPKYFENSKL